MTGPIKLLIISTNRADWGHVEPLFTKAQHDQRFKVDVFRYDADESTYDDVPGMSLADVVLFQGDRTELLTFAAQAVNCGKIIAHCAGGERTKGSTDDCVRDALTKLAHLHYPVHEQARACILALQEEDWRICVSGEVGVDDIKNKPLMTAAELMSAFPGVFKRAPDRGDLIVAVHPVTNRPQELAEVLDVVERMAGSWPGRAYLSTPNGESGSGTIKSVWGTIKACSNGTVLPSLGAHAFRSLMALCGTIAGNSSSLITEAPHLGCLPILIGTRQEGRFPAESDGNACGRILDHLYATVTSRGDALRVKA